MTCEELKNLLQDSSNILVDVRTPYEFQQARIKNSLLIPLHELPQNITNLKNKNVYVYCRSGARSGQAEAFLKANGINAKNIGGITNFIDCLVYGY